jgi:hypothetical protein
MRSRLFRKIGAYLGMFAILMATLAPTVSQAIVAQRSRIPVSHPHCAMPSMQHAASMAMNAMPMAEVHDAQPAIDMAALHALLMPMPMDHAMYDGSGAHGDHRHSMASHGDACGYCSFFAHLPVVPVFQTPFAITVHAIEHRVATRFDSVRRVEPLTFAQARAPPVRS